MKPSFSRRMAYSQMTNVMNKEEAKQPKKFEFIVQERKTKDIRNEFISKPLHVLFQEQADRTPEAIAINIDRKTMSYADLRHHMIEVAWRLQADLGISKGDVVGIQMERRYELIVCMLAINQIGAAFLPMDVNSPKERTEYMLNESRCKVVCRIRNNEIEIDTMRLPDPNPTSIPSETYSVLFTSGSTGQPKGVINSHKGITNMIWNMQSKFQLTKNDKVLFASPHVFDVSMMEIFWPLLNGAQVCIAPAHFTQNPEKMFQWLNAHEVNVAQFVPGVLQLFQERVDYHQFFPSRLRLLLNCGEALTQSLRDKMVSLLPKNIEFFNLYGPTETSIQITSWNCKSTQHNKVQVGYPFQGVQTCVLDENLNLVKDGDLGELWVSGDQTSVGYLNQPDKTKEKFRNGWYGTGDLVKMDKDGCLEHHGRMDNQIKLNGYRIELGEIESVLEKDPKTKRAVCGVSKQGSLVAFVLREKEIGEMIFKSLPSYMIPQKIYVVNEFPLTESGKVDRKKLMSSISANQKNDETQEIKELFAELLMLPVTQIQNNSSFLELGGNSIGMSRLLIRLSSLYGVEIDVEPLWAHPSPKAIHEMILILKQGVLKQGVIEQGVIKQGVIEQGVIEQGVLKQGVLKQGVIEQGVIKQGVIEQGVIEQGVIKQTNDYFSLADVQKRLWFIHELMPTKPLYNIPMAFCYKGVIDSEKLQHSFSQLIERHPAFNLEYISDNGIPKQRFAREKQVQWVSGTFKTRQDAICSIHRFCALPFNIVGSPLIRALYLRNPQSNESYFALSIHHLACDGWSMGILMKELQSLYQNKPLPELKHSYDEYCRWCSTQTVSKSKSLNHWYNHLVTCKPLEMPTDFPKPTTRSYKGDTVFFTLDTQTTQQLRAFNTKFGSSTFVTLWSAYLVMLSRYTHQHDIVVGVPIANRPLKELETIVGFFANTLALRSRFQPETTFQELVLKNRSTATTAPQFQDLPFDELVQQMNGGSDRELFQVMFVCQNNHNWCASIDPNVGAEWIPISTKTSKFEMVLQVMDHPELKELPCYLEFATDLFERKTAEQFVETLKCVLKEALQNPFQTVEKFNLPGSFLKAKSSLKTIPLLDQIQKHVLLQPNAKAVWFGDQSLTYQELWARAGQVHRYLKNLSLPKGNIIAVLAERSAEFVVACLGIMMSKHVLLALDACFPDDRLSSIILDAKPSVLLYTEKQKHKLQSSSVNQIRYKEPIGLFENESRLFSDQPFFAPPQTNTDSAYIVYTSGTTGKPKGIEVPFGAYTNYLQEFSQSIPTNSKSVYLQLAAHSFDVYPFELATPLIHGGQLVMVPGGTQVDPDRLISVISKRKVTSAFFVPQIMKTMLDTWKDMVVTDPFLYTRLTSLNQIFVGGEAVTPSLVKQIWSNLGPEVTVVNMYGPSEVPFSAFHTVRKADILKRKIPVGLPIQNMEAHLLDKRQNKVPIGALGELYLSSKVGLANGYLNRKEETKERFVDIENKKMYRTGDWMRLNPGSGLLEFMGRTDDQIKLNGVRIELCEIEKVIQEVEGVQSVVVMKIKVKETDQLAAFITPLTAPIVTIRSVLNQKLPRVMVPSYLMAIESMPMGSTGKASRKAKDYPPVTEANETILKPAIEKCKETPKVLFLREIVLKAWASVLEVSSDKVSLDESFLSMGGSSLASVRVLAQIRLALKLNTALELPLFFQFPTVRCFVNHVLVPLMKDMNE